MADLPSALDVAYRRYRETIAIDTRKRLAWEAAEPARAREADAYARRQLALRVAKDHEAALAEDALRTVVQKHGAPEQYVALHELLTHECDPCDD